MLLATRDLVGVGQLKNNIEKLSSKIGVNEQTGIVQGRPSEEGD